MVWEKTGKEYLCCPPLQRVHLGEEQNHSGQRQQRLTLSCLQDQEVEDLCDATTEKWRELETLSTSPQKKDNETWTILRKLSETKSSRRKRKKDGTDESREDSGAAADGVEDREHRAGQGRRRTLI